VVIVGRTGACHGRPCWPFPLPLEAGDSTCAGSIDSPKVLLANFAVHFPSRGYFSFRARLSQSCGRSGACISARYPIARQSRLVTVSEMNHSLSPRSSFNGSQNSEVTASSRNWFRCVLLPSKLETVSFGFRNDFGICAVILDSSVTSSCAVLMSRDDSPRCCERFFAAERSLGGVVHALGHDRMDA
jgi:hypothetical protein